MISMARNPSFSEWALSDSEPVGIVGMFERRKRKFMGCADLGVLSKCQSVLNGRRNALRVIAIVGVLNRRKDARSTRE